MFIDEVKIYVKAGDGGNHGRSQNAEVMQVSSERRHQNFSGSGRHGVQPHQRAQNPTQRGRRQVLLRHSEFPGVPALAHFPHQR